MKYELTFVGGSTGIRYRSGHSTFESAETEAKRVLRTLELDGLRNAHPAIIYGPEFNPDGFTIR